MKKTLKAVALFLGVAVVSGGLGWLGLNMFARVIYAQRTCEWVNIDNIELHTKVNIPDINDYDCDYSKELNAKTARFNIDTARVDMDRYIRLNSFRKITQTDGIILDSLLAEESNIHKLHASDLYYTSGAYKGETWQSLLNNSTGTLWVVIRYKD